MMVRKGKRRDLQHIILSTYFRDLSLETGLSSRRERTPHAFQSTEHMLLFFTATCCDYTAV